MDKELRNMSKTVFEDSQVAISFFLENENMSKIILHDKISGFTKDWILGQIRVWIVVTVV